MKRLIVNADDFNLTRGTSLAILTAHQKGVVSSTSVFTNFNFEHDELNQLRKLRSIGVGLHLNATLDRPLTQPELIKSLVDSNGIFKKLNKFRESKIDQKHLLIEFEAQFLNFRSIFSRNPDHLNTHHHLHAYPKVAKVVIQLAQKYQISVRRSEALTWLLVDNQKNLVLSNYFFGSLNPLHYWTEVSLLNIFRGLPNGTSEIMCHPAYFDRNLAGISSFAKDREKEFHLFSNPKIRRILQSENIILQTKF